jgi:REP element-mobilizing transposase RayT
MEHFMTYWRLHYHLIWATFDRQPALDLGREKVFYGVLYQKAKELDLIIHAAGNVDDHVHIVVSIPPKMAVADCVRHMKGASARAINALPGNTGKFKWQEGYGALTIDELSLDRVMKYVAKQKEHHKERTILQQYEKLND